MEFLSGVCAMATSGAKTSKATVSSFHLSKICVFTAIAVLLVPRAILVAVSCGWVSEIDGFPRAGTPAGHPEPLVARRIP